MAHQELRRTLTYIAPYWKRLGGIVLLSLLGTALSLVLPYLSVILVDRALLGRDVGLLVAIIGVSVAITLVSFALNVVSGIRYTKVSADILFDMRLALFQHLQRLSPRFYARMPLGQIASRINSDIGEVQRVVTEVALAWIGNVVFLAGSIVFLLSSTPSSSRRASSCFPRRSSPSCGTAAASRRRSPRCATGARTSGPSSSRPSRG